MADGGPDACGGELTRGKMSSGAVVWKEIQTTPGSVKKERRPIRNKLGLTDRRIPSQKRFLSVKPAISCPYEGG